MRWRTNPVEGWHTGFALFPVQCDDGQTVWLEPFRYYCNSLGWVTNRLPKE